MSDTLTLDVLRQAVAGQSAAFRCRTEYQPVGGATDKVFPPTYEGGKYAVETRVVGGQPVECVLLDSVQSQANRMEEALIDAIELWGIKIPLVSVKFEKLPKPVRVTSLDAPHRIADAIFRDSLLPSENILFRESSKGRPLDTVNAKNARALFALCPTALIFGLWDSTGPRGGLGAKFQRAIVSEIVGYHAQAGVRTSSRMDPLQITLSAGRLYERATKNSFEPAWTLDPNLAALEKQRPRSLGREGRPSEANHGNVTPRIADGGFTISHALQTTVLSLTALRRLRFPADGASVSDRSVDLAGRTLLAALGLMAASLARGLGADLRSRCQLFPTAPFVWELLDVPGQPPNQFVVGPDEAIVLFNEALRSAQTVGLPWEEEIELVPSESLLTLVLLSQQTATSQSIDVRVQ